MLTGKRNLINTPHFVAARYLLRGQKPVSGSAGGLSQIFARPRAPALPALLGFCGIIAGQV